MSGDSSHSSPMPDNHCPVIRMTFCGLQNFWFKMDRFYKFYVTDEGLYVAWIGGQVHDAFSIRAQFSPLYPLLIGFLIIEPLAMILERRRRDLELQYGALISEPVKFFAVDERNFFLSRDGIHSIRISRRRTWWYLWMNSGKMDVVLPNGEPIRLILLRDPPEVRTLVDHLVAAEYAAAFVA
jgi:hypothetical protein